MKRTFVRLPSFEKAWAAMNLTEDDYIMLYAYPKSAKEDLTKAEIAELRKLTEILKKGM